MGFEADHVPDLQEGNWAIWHPILNGGLIDVVAPGDDGFLEPFLPG